MKTIIATFMTLKAKLCFLCIFYSLGTIVTHPFLDVAIGSCANSAREPVRVGRQQLSAEPLLCRRSPNRRFQERMIIIKNIRDLILLPHMSQTGTSI